jgi:lysozyme
MNDDLDYDRSGLDLTVASEGMVLNAYPDPGTKAEPWTIGVGHTGGVYPGQTITEEEGYQLLHDDIQVAVHAVKRLVTVPLTQGEFNALVDFTFNCGAGNLSSSTLLRLLNSGDYDGASTHFKDWVKAGGRILPGLVTRRENEERIFNASDRSV